MHSLMRSFQRFCGLSCSSGPVAKVVPGANVGTTGCVMGRHTSVATISQALTALLVYPAGVVHKQCRRRTCEW
jgi:hypothetical protein